jgi:hypothetical protein
MDPFSAAILAGGSLLTAGINVKQASKNRGFQRNMANTQYQRAAKDLEAAGLNRVLALGGPAAAPTGSTAQAPDMGSTAVAGYSAAQQAKKTAEEVKLLKQTTAKTKEETRLTNAEADKQEVMKRVYDVLGPTINTVSGGLGEWLQQQTNSAKDSIENDGWLKRSRRTFDNWVKEKRKESAEWQKRNR